MPFRLDPRPVFDARMAIHVALTAVMAWVGVDLLLPGNTFGGSAAWRLFQQVGSEAEWALAFLAAAIVGVIGIETSRRWVRVVSVLLLATAHGTVALLFLFGNPAGAASGTFGVWALLGYYLAARQAVWRRVR